MKLSQHGFIKDKLHSSNLYKLFEDATGSIDSGDPIDVVYLDFQKVFGKVQHNVYKLKAHDIKVSVLDWIEN